MRLMKKNFKVLFLAVFVAATSCSFTTKDFDDPDKDKLLIDLITYVLEKGHYDAKDLNDEFSAGVHKDFINALDPIKRYFLASDIEEFSAYTNEIDDQIKNKDLTFFNLAYDRLMQRMKEGEALYKEVLEKPFDYTINESINVDYDNTTYATTKKELKERWRIQLKFSTISTYYDYIEDNGMPQSGDEASLEENKPKTRAELEDKARTATRTNLEDYFEFTSDLERKDYFAIFLNTIVEEFDPHTNYFAPPDRDRFDLRMSGKLEGIGARLQKKNDYIKVVEIISGGPAWRGEHIEVGDMIMKSEAGG